MVFEVAFSDNVYWVAKVQYAAADDSDAVYMLSEIATMKLVQERTTIPVPRVFGHQTRSSGDFNFPFILMEFLPGRDVGGPLARDVPAECLSKVAKQLADVVLQLERESYHSKRLVFFNVAPTALGQLKLYPHPLKAMAMTSTNSPTYLATRHRHHSNSFTITDKKRIRRSWSSA